MGKSGDMMLVRRLARPMIAGYFVARGVRLLRNPEEGTPAVARAESFTDRVGFLPKDPVALVRLNAGVQTAFGVLLAAGRFPRLSALALAGTAVPTAVARHPFWEETDPQAREEQQNALLAELSITGGLLLAAVDTEGSPSLAWRARRAARSTRKATGAAVRATGRDVRSAGTSLKGGAAAVREKLPV